MGLSGTDPALMYAIANVARSGATRSGYHSVEAFITIGGVHVGVGPASASYKVNGLTITDVLNESPNTCSCEIAGLAPTVGQELIVALGSKSNGRRLFAGHILTVAQAQVASVSTVHHAVSAVDYTWQLGFLKVTAFYSEQSATPIAQSLITAYAAANGFTAVNVEAGLPTVPGGITFTDEDLPQALTRLAARIGGYWYVDYRKDLHFFLTDTAQIPTALTTAHETFTNFVPDIDLSQHINRVYVEGRGTTLLSAVPIGSTIIPLESVDMFTVTAGVFAKLSFAGSDGGAQRLTYAGVIPGGGGTLVGPGTGPAAAPALDLVAGAGLGSGVYQYAYTDVTPSGESLPSPIGSVTTGGLIADPTFGPTGSYSNGGAGPFPFAVGDAARYWAYTWVTPAGETLPSPSFAPSVPYPLGPGGPYKFGIANLALGPAGTTQRKIYRTVAGGAQLKLVATIADNTTTSYTDQITDAALGANVPTSNTAAAGNQVAVSGIAIGASPTTQRKVYRTAVGGAQLKLLTTIADNTTTTYADSTADGSLGANVPTSDTSALTQPDGQVLAGAITLLVAGAGSFQTGGGWALIGNGSVIRYTGITGNTLTGIPASGTGSISSTVAYNSTVTAAPMLTGIPASGAGSIASALTAGDEVYLVVQRDDLSAQATLASRLGGTGIREEWIQDRRLSIPEATARGDAFLASRPLDAARVRYACQDLNTVSGPTITVSLGAPTSVSGTFRIQRVTISNFQPALRPTFSVEASDRRWSFEDLLRLTRKAA